MSGASDKARFYLEQSVPELKEYERKKIFTSDEIKSITTKRSDFEHKINARGALPTDFVRYAEFEINVDALRRKRVKRLGIRAPAHNGQRRIFFVFDRGTRKFSGDVGLWIQSIEFAKRQKAYKKLSQIFTNVLRLHPTKSELWIYAAQFAVEENGDMTEARGYLQRGLRFCKNSRSLWLEYAKLELIYIAKIAARRRILGIGEATPIAEKQDVNASDDITADVMRLPVLTAEDVNPTAAGRDDIDQAALQILESTPAMSGAIPLAVFDAAMVQFNYDPALALDFYELVITFDQVPCLRQLINHIDQHLTDHAALSWQAQVCHIRSSVDGIPVSSPQFPAALGTCISLLKACLPSAKDSKFVTDALHGWISSLLDQNGLDPALRRVLQSQRRSLLARAST